MGEEQKMVQRKRSDKILKQQTIDENATTT